MKKCYFLIIDIKSIIKCFKNIISRLILDESIYIICINRDFDAYIYRK